MHDFRPPDKQKREDGRLKVELFGRYRLENLEEWKACTIYNISSGGVLIEGKESFYNGDKLELRMQLESFELEVNLIVTNINGRKAGCIFADIDPKKKAIIRNYVHENLGFK